MYSGSLPTRRLRMGLLAGVAALGLLLVTAVGVLANTVNIYDNAGVLNASQVRSVASSLQYPIDIYTTNFNGSRSQFDQAAKNRVRANTIIVAIDTNHRYLDVFYGRGVSLSPSQVDDARAAFANAYQGNQDYTAATIALIRSLGDATGSSSGSGFDGAAPVSNPRGFNWSPLCCIGLLILAGLAFFAITRARRPRSLFFNQRPNQYNQPPNYGPGYPQQNRGMNPWAAGGLGAAAGGLAGYQMGRQAGEREGQGSEGQGADFGGGSGGDFGGGQGRGQGGDFGGNSGGDFGRGQGGDFGGSPGGDFGGGQGGDFGGSSGGDFGGGQGGGQRGGGSSDF